jgi:phosphoribosyl-ATP pyrophosphohydrolase/phosphoribosyl-AMP cyclohydrolase
MLGYMNKDALIQTIETKRVTFYSRSKERLWTKGESSNHFLTLTEAYLDCDKDAILVKVHPEGPTCHTGDDTCWSENNTIKSTDFIIQLEETIKNRKENPSESSYTSSLFKKGINKIAQKVGEEAIEIVIESKDNDSKLFLGEAADLLFHYLILLQAKGFTLDDVVDVLKQRNK